MARQSKGRLFKRGKSGNYYLEHFVNKKRICKRLLDENGKPITKEREAEKARDRELFPLKARDEEERKRQVASAYEAARDKAVQAYREARRTEIKKMWDKNPYDVSMNKNTERQLSASTIEDNRCQWMKFVNWTEKRDDIQYAEDVTPELAKEFQDYLKKEDGLSGDRTNKVILCCKVMFQLSGVELNPFQGLRKQHHRAIGRNELTVAELNSVCRNASGELRTLFALGLYTGMRLGDCVLLQWRQINAELTRLSTDASKTAYKADNQHTIPIHSALQAILAETPEDRRKDFVLPELAGMYKERRDLVSKRIQQHFIDCGIKTNGDKDGRKRKSVTIGFHSLRHSFISICAREGVPLHVVQNLAGHTKQVQQHYLHANDEDSQRAINSLPTVTGTADDSEDKLSVLREKTHELVDRLQEDDLENILKRYDE